MTVATSTRVGGLGRPPSPTLVQRNAPSKANENSSSTVMSTVQVRIGDLYWKQDGPCGWVLGQVLAHDTTNNSVRFCYVDESTGEMHSSDEYPPETLALDQSPLFPANPLFSTAADMTSLRHLHEAALAKNLQDRSSLQNQRPYTFMANVLIAVNPLRELQDPDKQLFVAQSLDRCPPHPYYIAENAYRQLCAVRAVMQNQSIIISGESGSGKTETSKIILDFLTTRAIRTSRSTSFASEDDMEPEVTPTVHPPPPSITSALSYPQSSRSDRRLTKLSPVALGERLMETIPILESFGNAKTHRNHNSSRFGKYMRLQFSNSTHELSGASIDTYLLEKSRLVSQPTGERNFHVFYELLHSKKVDYVKNELHLLPKQPEAYAYLNQSGCLKAELIDDGENFQNLCRALEFVGIQDEAQHEIFRVVAGLLHLGNVTISEEDTSEGKTACIAPDDEASKQALEHASALLGVAQHELSQCMLVKRIMTRGSRRNSVYYAKRDLRNAVYSRDTIAKTIYEHVFTWLMMQCAYALDYDSERSDVIPYIGVLDIFGFEDFEPKNRNSFEQLLINYANEALQSLFNACIFEAEQELYRSEHIYTPLNHSLTFPFGLPGVPMPVRKTSSSDTTLQLTGDESDSVVEYTDNRECLNLIASRHGGIFTTIDNVSRLPAPTDRKLNERLHTLFKRHTCFPTPHPKDARDMFIIKHYAGTVKYHINSFVDKNNNIVSDQFEELIKRSTSRILQEIIGRDTPSGQEKSSRGGGKRSSSVKGGSASSLFSTQMKGLTTELEGTACNFVRCIKPNTQMKPGIFDRPFVVEQLRCSGTVQACEVLRVGLPTRILYAEVVDVYKHLLPADMLQKFDFNEKLFTQSILWSYTFPTEAYRLGDTRLFFRTGKIDLLDKLLTPSSDSTAIDKLSADMLLYLRKKRWIGVATKMIACNIFKQIYYKCKYRRKAIIIQSMVRQHFARKRVRKLRVLHRISGVWNRISHRAQIMRAYQDRPEDKMVLLDKLLQRNYLPPDQRWLLKWLGPLQKVIYLQKLWKKVMAQYLAKRAFIWLLETVRQKRSALRMQAMARCMIARKLFKRLKTARLARERWRRGYLKVRVFCVFRRELHSIHVKRLENDNEMLVDAVREAEERVRAAVEEANRLRAKYQQMEAALNQKTAQVAEQTQRIDQLESELDDTQDELADLRHHAQNSMMERVIRFFTCSSATALPPVSPARSGRKKKPADVPTMAKIASVPSNASTVLLMVDGVPMRTSLDSDDEEDKEDQGNKESKGVQTTEVQWNDSRVFF
ncbi:hypothetical protein Poli38472_006389 [Pythium oligandrum]|uniref:Myosin motor domain-containing protein n=1 Tax=Pythium oligandrum TaxID=41045 RepID=A0A8K1C4I3_PYTOL|nr:hypothetical protein Poli38472_006389 [Pythium oligandrum]|eukprot:TMW56379.1 hypothetical protein Poli38472_006389 [Pythium oligandrum]